MKHQPCKRYYRVHNIYQRSNFFDWHIQHYCIFISLSCCKIIIVYTPVKECNSMTISITTQNGHMQKWAVLCTLCCALPCYLHTLWYKSILNKTYVALLCQLLHCYEPSKARCGTITSTLGSVSPPLLEQKEYSLFVKPTFSLVLVLIVPRQI